MDDGSSSQWSLGIDHVLRCTEYMTNLFPRKMSSSRTDNTLFSVHFRLCHAGMFLTLSSLLTSKEHSSLSSSAATPLQLVNVALSASKALVSYPVMTCTALSCPVEPMVAYEDIFFTETHYSYLIVSSTHSVV